MQRLKARNGAEDERDDTGWGFARINGRGTEKDAAESVALG
jgi:hypothetical protein